MDSSGTGPLVAMRHQGHWTGRQVPPGSDRPKTVGSSVSTPASLRGYEIEPNPMIRAARRLLVERHKPLTRTQLSCEVGLVPFPMAELLKSPNRVISEEARAGVTSLRSSFGRIPAGRMLTASECHLLGCDRSPLGYQRQEYGFEKRIAERGVR
jgi:hypothetical protein